MPKTDGLTEKQKIFNESNFPLIQLYLDGFIAGVNAFCESDIRDFILLLSEKNSEATGIYGI